METHASPPRGRARVLFLRCLLVPYLALAACSTASGSDGLTVHVLANAAATPLADDTGSYLCGLDPSAGDRSLLFVLLPGTGGSPSGLTRVLKAAARDGYHVLGLAYPSGTSLGSLCRNDLAAYGPARQEICTGSDSSGLVDMPPGNSIEGRLKAVLTVLATDFPGEGWGDWIDGTGQPVWNRMVIGGFSQGAGHAAWLASRHEVAGAVLFSGVVDATTSGDPRTGADWLAEAAGTLAAGRGYFGATPLVRIRSFVHQDDKFLPGIRANLASLGLDWNDRVSVDAAGATTGGPGDSPVPRLYGAANATGSAHGAPCADDATPLANDGTPVFLPVWNALLDFTPP